MKQNGHIFLIGFMGCGKSTNAKVLSDMMGAAQLEMDEEIAAREGMAITEIFAVHGEEYFRSAETELIRSLRGKESMVVSCGGGAVLREENVGLMKRMGTIVLLTASPETVYGRVKGSTERPVLNGHMSVDDIRSLMEKRRPRYEAAADLVVSTDKKDAKEICREILLLAKKSKGEIRMGNDFMKEAREMKEELVGWRRALHQIPEIGTHLPKTVEYVTARLEEMGIAYKVYEDCSCVTATLGNGGKCILLRSDMDGLPIKEESGEPFASVNGCMHACGHDFHAATLLGVAKMLKAYEEELKGTVKLIFQSGEETFAGASAAVKHGIMENPKVDAAFAAHVFGSLPVNTIVYGIHEMASVYGFRIRIQGKGTHGSSPETGVDPINVGVHIYLGLQELISREISARDEATLTIGHFDAGSAANILPDSAMLEGTLRTFDPEVRKFMISRIHEIVEGTAKTYRASAAIEVLSDVPTVICDRSFMNMVADSIKELDPSVAHSESMHLMGSEDFAFYSELVPSMFCGIGAGVEDPSRWAGQHNPKIVFNEDALPLAAALYVKVAADWLEANK